ncbi:unnamed protein product [Schistosoma turkestanicum]|nr:unnamed protein product [Schistosoma turkestanicum]
MSGILPTEDCEIKFRELKMKNCYRYIVFKIDNGQIQVERFAGRDSNYDDFLHDTRKPEQARFAVLDFECEGIKGSNLIFVSWVCNTAPIKTKMLYASSRQALRSRFQGIKLDLNAYDLGDLELPAVIDLVTEKHKSH